METLIAPFINLLLLVGILVWKVREPLRNFVSARHISLRDELQKTGDQLRQAQERYDEFTAKLKAIEAEISALRDQARQDAEGMKLRVLSDAKRLAALIVSDARLAGETLFSDLRMQLTTEFANRVVEKAEGLLRVRLTGDDRVRIRREFSMQVEQIQ